VSVACLMQERVPNHLQAEKDRTDPNVTFAFHSSGIFYALAGFFFLFFFLFLLTRTVGYQYWQELPGYGQRRGILVVLVYSVLVVLREWAVYSDCVTESQVDGPFSVWAPSKTFSQKAGTLKAMPANL